MQRESGTGVAAIADQSPLAVLGPYLAMLSSLRQCEKGGFHNTLRQRGLCGHGLSEVHLADRQFVRSAFDEYPYFDARMSLQEIAQTIAGLCSCARLSDNAHCLSVGSGPLIYETFYGKYVIPRGLLACIDVNESIMRYGQRVLNPPANLQLAEADMVRLPFADSVFDFTYSYAAIHWCVDPSRAIRELLRVTKCGGIMHITYDPTFMGHERAIDKCFVGANVLASRPLRFVHPGYGEIREFQQVVGQKADIA